MDNIVPRNDYLVFRRVLRGKTQSGIRMPDMSLEGMDHVVEAIGPDVKTLNVGDKILILGQIGQDYGQVPTKKDLFVTRQHNVVATYVRPDVVITETGIGRR